MIARLTVVAIATMLLAACASGSSGGQPTTAVADPMGAAALSEPQHRFSRKASALLCCGRAIRRRCALPSHWINLPSRGLA